MAEKAPKQRTLTTDQAMSYLRKKGFDIIDIPAEGIDPMRLFFYKN